MAILTSASVARPDTTPRVAPGREWIVDAYGCDPAALRDLGQLGRLIDRLIVDLSLTPIGPRRWHTFPPPGGITGFVLLAESHIACHTFPEFGSICVNVFCCRPRPDLDARALMHEVLGATETHLRCLERALVLPDEPGR